MNNDDDLFLPEDDDNLIMNELDEEDKMIDAILNKIANDEDLKKFIMQLWEKNIILLIAGGFAYELLMKTKIIINKNIKTHDIDYKFFTDDISKINLYFSNFMKIIYNILMDDLNISHHYIKYKQKIIYIDDLDDLNNINDENFLLTYKIIINKKNYSIVDLSAVFENNIADKVYFYQLQSCPVLYNEYLYKTDNILIINEIYMMLDIMRMIQKINFKYFLEDPCDEYDYTKFFKYFQRFINICFILNPKEFQYFNHIYTHNIQNITYETIDSIATFCLPLYRNIKNQVIDILQTIKLSNPQYSSFCFGKTKRLK